MIRRLLVILFLYILLVWIVVTLLFSSETHKLWTQGLWWTAAGVAALLLGLILERVITSVRARRAEKAAAPAAPMTAEQSARMHEDDAALIGLLNEADQRLAQAPREADAKPLRVIDLPLYLIVGPERAGKSTIVQNSGIEPSLLAGQVLGGGPTRIANLWLAEQALFLEVSGRVFNSDPARLAEFLSRLQPGGGVQAPFWRRLFKPAAQPVHLRGVVLVMDALKFSGTPEPSELDRSAQQTRERLFAIASALGTELPVYVVFTKTDGLRYFGEFFARLAEGETGQLFGVLTIENSPELARDRVWAEAETKRLNQFFQSLFLRLGDRRLLALTQEAKAGPKPAIYEFPREFKRIRTPLVQFLVDTFKPDPLKAGARLRGFFFTATRKAERQAGVQPEARSTYSTHEVSSEATQIFAPEMRTSYGDGGSVFRKLNPESPSGQLVDQWLFATDFFHKVLTQDRPVVRRVAPQSKLDKYHQIALAAIAAVAIFFGVVWTISYVANWRVSKRVETASEDVSRASGGPSLANLQALDRLRVQLIAIDTENPWHLHWGLYIGNGLREAARRIYFERLRRLGLMDIDHVLVSRLEAGTANAAEGTGPTYERLKTYRTITNLACPVDKLLVPKVLKASAGDAFPRLGDDQMYLLHAQLDYYTSQLDRYDKPPVKLDEDSEAVRKARAYLTQAGGLDQQLRAMVTELNRQIPSIQVADYAQNYTSVISGPSEFPGAYTKKGLALFNDLVSKGNFGGGGEACVMGATANVTQGLMDAETRERLKSLYHRQYAAAWREFLGGFKVIRYSSTEDASRRLNTLSGPASPLLGIVKMVAVNTYFPSTKPVDPGAADKLVQKLGFGSTKTKIENAGKTAETLLNGDAPLMTDADLSRLFQPASFTTPPDLDRLVNDNNRDYINGLRGLQLNLDALARASASERGATIPATRGALGQAHTAQTSLADKFSSVGNQGVNNILADLLDQPIRWAEGIIPANTEVASGGKKNGELAQFCRQMQPILSKYPFNSYSSTDATLLDIERGFAPTEGLVWKYVQQSGSDLVIKRGPNWEQNPALQGMKVATELLGFLDRASKLSGVLFSESGAMQPKLKYVLRPVSGQTIVIKLTLDGAEFSSQSPLQKTFYWPALPGQAQGANGTMESGALSTGFGRFDGLWGVFRLFENADDRPLGAKVVQWSEIRGRGGAVPQKINPPVKVEFVELPGGEDLFNPRFFDGLQCPKRAVTVNN